MNPSSRTEHRNYESNEYVKQLELKGFTFAPLLSSSRSSSNIGFFSARATEADSTSKESRPDTWNFNSRHTSSSTPSVLHLASTSTRKCMSVTKCKRCTPASPVTLENLRLQGRFYDVWMSAEIVGRTGSSRRKMHLNGLSKT